MKLKFINAIRLPALIIAMLLIGQCMLFAQQDDRLKFINDRLYQLSVSEAPGLEEKVAASVSGVSLSEFIRGIAIANNLNISVDPAINQKITVNFTNESVMNILLFLVKQYNIDIQFTGSIMYVSNYVAPPMPVVPEKELQIKYDASTNRLSLDIRNDSLYKVVRKIIQVSKKNVVITPDIANKQVSAFLQDLPLESAMDKFAFANQLQFTSYDSVFYLSAANTEATTSKKNTDPKKKSNNNQAPQELEGDFSLNIEKDVNGYDLITVNAMDASILNLIKVIAQELKIDYFLFADIQGKTTVNVTKMTFDAFLDYILQGSDYDVRKQGEIYLIGNRIQEGFTSSRFIQLQYRPTDIVVENIPSELKKGLEVKAFPELNSLIVSGPTIKVTELEKFITAIDKVVPVIMIEVIIVDVNNSKNVSTGIKAGIGDKPVTTQGTVFPGVDVTLGAKGINEILSLVTGTGVFNLGQVAPNFYVSLRMLEEQGVLKVRSTPKLSTLNGHEATMSIGKTDYYVEETNNIIGTQNPQTVVTRTFKPIKADFSITINPVVSGDDQVTLDINVKQSDFTTRISPDAPPGSSTREFKSLIRVRSDEMIVLGGLEENRAQDTGSGVPLLSRIPVLKWFFSSRDKVRSKTKLNIFIKPTIIY